MCKLKGIVLKSKTQCSMQYLYSLTFLEFTIFITNKTRDMLEIDRPSINKRKVLKFLCNDRHI